MSLEYYVLQTDTSIKPGLLYAARGFLLDKVPFSWNGWHNHDLASGHTIHRYPQVQYKLWKHQLSIVVLGSEKEQLFEFAKRFPMEGTLNRMPIRIQLKAIQRFEHQWVLQPPRWYRCSNFLPMKKEQYLAFKQLCHQLKLAPEKPYIDHPELLNFVKELLRQRVVEQIQSMGSQIDSNTIAVDLAPSPIKHSITSYYRNTLFSKFSNLNFSLNINWPLPLSLGYGAALGYGMLRPGQARDIPKKSKQDEPIFKKPR